MDQTGCVVPRKRVKVIFGEFDARNVDGYEVHKSKYRILLQSFCHMFVKILMQDVILKV